MSHAFYKFLKLKTLPEVQSDSLQLHQIHKTEGKNLKKQYVKS
jgi:hypothetical protein